MNYSVVIPFHNEQENVVELYRTLKEVMEEVCDAFEFIFVDDGSEDDTYRLLSEIADNDRRVTLVRLRRNFGKTEALAAGFEEATGEFVIVMDGDLQHDPHLIPQFIKKLELGYDVVCGCRVARPGDSLLLKRIPSRIANWLMARLTGVELHDFVGGFKAYRTSLIRQIPLYGELQRFIPVLAATFGARIAEFPIEIAPRKHGRSHYGFRRAIPFLFDIVTIPLLLRFATRPMHFFGTIGFGAMGLGMVSALWLVIEFFRGVGVMSEHGPLLFFSTILLLAGLLLISLGFLGELNVRHHYLAAQAPRDSEPLRVKRKKGQ
ncbi:MAG: glycosyltransferase family 2 protein [Acidobacteriota bacterium]